MKLLIRLAQVDGSVAQREKNFLLSIGRAHGMMPDQISALLQQQHEPVVPKNLSADEKFECIFSLVQLMKMDERMYQEELSFCGEVAGKLGYDKQVMAELLLKVKSGPMSDDEIQELKKSTIQYLKL